MTVPLQASQAEHGDSLVLVADRRQFPQLEEWLEEALTEAGMSRKGIIHLLIAADEIFSNIASYAYAAQEQPGMVEVSWQVDSERRVWKMCFRDSGVAFNPLQHAPDISAPAQKGGKGIFLVRQYADALEYRREDNRNILTLTKAIG